MCDPFSVALAAVAGGGSIMKGMAGADAHDFNAELASGNAELLQIQSKIAAMGGDLAMTRGNYDATLLKRKVDGVLGGQTAHFTANNIDPTFGAPLLAQGFTAAQGEVDRGLIIARAMGERADALTRGANIQGQAAGQAYKAASEAAAADVSMFSDFVDAGTAFLTTQAKWPMFQSAAGATPLPWNDNPFLLHQPSSL